MGWSAFWNGRTTIYVNDHHKRVHYEQIARDIAAVVPSSNARVLDFGCGEALSAGMVARRCRELVLCDVADTVRCGLVQRFRHNDRITVSSPAEVAAMPDASFDMIVANSVVQYLGRAQLELLLVQWRRLLAPNGRLVLGDLIPPDVGALTDASALLRFAGANGFLFAAGTGLVKTFFSDYRQKRAELGLLRFSEPEILRLVRSCGFDATRHHTNLGHNPARMTVVAHAAETTPDFDLAVEAPVYHQRPRERARPYEEVEIALFSSNRTQ